MDPLSDAFSQRLAAALALLDDVIADRKLLASVGPEERARLQRLCGEIARPDLKDRKKLQKELLRKNHETKREQDEQLRQSTAIRQIRAKPVYSTPPPTSEQDMLPSSSSPADQPNEPGPELNTDRVCYVCKTPYQSLHFFYDQLCQSCGDISHRKRAPRFDLTGRTAVITGARVKIGYHAAILLLRNGADVVVTTRFPRDGAARFAREPDFDEWKHRLTLYGLDLRHTPSVDALARHLSTTLPRLDFLLHNACQTVRRPPGFYAHLVEHETQPLSALPAAERCVVEADAAFRAADPSLPLPARMSQLDADSGLALPSSSSSSSSSSLASIFPAGALDQDLQQIDLRTHNSWRAALGEVPTIELLEVLLVNAAAPFVLTSKLRPLLERDNAGRDRHVVNVSAMEGQFYRANKTDKHPHTNMAKAALNMLTRTSAQDLGKAGVWMNAVDTGWVTDEDPAHLAALKVKEHRFSPPLDVVDGAARIVDPIFAGLQTGKHACGVFFKDYLPARW
ncbi:MAG: SDR family oxidoreductase [Deltaproteobacteria bacterium]|nr:SDR family oxidoreductase [Deltaproteobacteria bacterium]